MQIKFKAILAGATALTLMSAGTADARTPPPRNLYVFGGNNVLTGNDGWFWDYQAQFNTRTAEYRGQGSLGWEGRNSNGPNWTERLGYDTGLAPGLNNVQAPWGGFSAPNRGYNFAHAEANLDGIYQRDFLAFTPQLLGRAIGTGMVSARTADGQIDAYNRFVAEGKIVKRANDLFVYSFSPVLYCAPGRTCDDDATIAYTTTVATQNLIKYQNSAHARANILIMGEIDQYSWITSVGARGTSLGASASDVQRVIDIYDRQNATTVLANEGLGIAAGALRTRTNRAKTWYVDPNPLIRDIVARKEAYGIKFAAHMIEANPRSASGITYFGGNCLFELARAVPLPCNNDYLWYRPGVLSSRGHDIMAYYVASTIGGVYAWDQYRAVGSGSGGAGAATSRVVATASGKSGFAFNSLGLTQVEGGRGARLFSFGLDGEETSLGLTESRGGSLKLIGSSVQLTPSLSVGATSFVDNSRDGSLDTRVRGYGASGFANFELGSGMDLNILATSQNRTLNTNRPITFSYVGGVARAQTKVRLDVAQASLSRMFEVRGVKVGPVVGVASLNERWGETRETGVPEWLALNSAAVQTSATALNLGLATEWSHRDQNGATWSLSAKAGRIQADEWAPVALVAPSQTLADALEQERGSANFVTVSGGREHARGWSFGLEAGIAQTEERDVQAMRGRAVLKF